jgi:hypothetical protein
MALMARDIVEAATWDAWFAFLDSGKTVGAFSYLEQRP